MYQLSTDSFGLFRVGILSDHLCSNFEENGYFCIKEKMRYLQLGSYFFFSEMQNAASW